MNDNLQYLKYRLKTVKEKIQDTEKQARHWMQTRQFVLLATTAAELAALESSRKEIDTQLYKEKHKNLVI